MKKRARQNVHITFTCVPVVLRRPPIKSHNFQSHHGGKSSTYTVRLLYMNTVVPSAASGATTGSSSSSKQAQKSIKLQTTIHASSSFIHIIIILKGNPEQTSP